MTMEDMRMIDYGWFTVLFVSFLVGAMSNRHSIIWLLRLFLLFVLTLLCILWESGHGWPGFFNAEFALFAYWPTIAAIVGLVLGAHTQPLPQTVGGWSQPDKPFPLYLLQIGEKREFIPITHVHSVYQSPYKVEIEGLVLNDDFSVREVNRKEEKELKEIAEAYGTTD